jgi:hypothetical protein
MGDFSTEPGLRAHLDRMRDVVREEIRPLGTPDRSFAHLLGAVTATD